MTVVIIVVIIMLAIIFLPLLISIGMIRLVKIIVMALLGLIGAFYLYPRLFPSLEMQLFSGIENHCKNKKDCTVHLYEIMPFKWDKAYFFLEENGYSNQDIQRITGVKEDFDLGRGDVLVLFKYQNHLVKYDVFQVYDHTDLKFSFPSWGVNKTVSIGLMMRKSTLDELHYSGDINQFNDIVYIKYYEITPQNDLLHAGCTLDKYFQGSIKTCMLNFTNLDQVYLEKPLK